MRLHSRKSFTDRRVLLMSTELMTNCNRHSFRKHFSLTTIFHNDVKYFNTLSLFGCLLTFFNNFYDNQANGKNFLYLSLRNVCKRFVRVFVIKATTIINMRSLRFPKLFLIELNFTLYFQYRDSLTFQHRLSIHISQYWFSYFIFNIMLLLQ